jgi:hypothetical protein
VEESGKGKVTFTLEQATKAQRGSRGITLLFLSAQDEGGWSTPRPGRFTPGKETRYPFYRRLVGPRAGLDGCGKSRPPPTGIRSLDRPTRSQSLYRLSYRGPEESGGGLIDGISRYLIARIVEKPADRLYPFENCARLPESGA